MPRLRFAPMVVIALSVPLSGCGGGMFGGGFDPSDMLGFLDNKKPLPGERRPVFPEGVPGVDRGVPPEMVRGSPEALAARQEFDQSAVPQAQPYPSGQGMPDGVNAPAAQPAPGTSTAAAPHNIAPAAPPRPKGPPARRRSITAPEPEASPAAPQQPAPAPQANQSVFPSPFPQPVQGGSFQRQ